MKARTEDDILSRAPILVKLGDKEYSIPLLAVMAQREWRKKYVAELAPIFDSLEYNTLDLKSFVAGVTSCLLQFPDKLIDLVFTYRGYGFLWESLIAEGVSDKLLAVTFLSRVAAADIPEPPDFPHESILLHANEEQFATAFSSIMAVAFPSMPHLSMARQILRAAAPTPTLR
jgi:hypothetical protein